MDYEKISGFSDEIDADIKTQFTVLNRLGIHYFEPRGINGKNISELGDEEVSALKACMEAYGIQASSIGSPIGKIKLEDDFEPHFELFKRVVKTAKAIGSRYIRMFSFYHEGDGDWTEAERGEVLARLRRMIEYAAGQDVVLLHENEKGIYGDIASRCLDLMRELSGEYFGAVFDPANFIQSGQDTKEAYELLKPYIRYMHIKDAHFSDGKVVPAGYGDGNVPFILKSLFDEGYEGYLSLEPHLGSFTGLNTLGLDEERMSRLPKGGEGTFTIAAEALREILAAI